VGRNCHKCKVQPADTTIKQNEAYCTPCLEQGVLQRVRAATKGKQLLASGDTLLVALSGGPASLVLLYCLLQTQSSNANRPERGKVVMHITPIHILPPGLDLAAAEQQVQQVLAAVESVGYSGDVYVVPLEALYQQPPQLQLFRATARAQATQQQQQQQQQEEGQSQDTGVSHGSSNPAEAGTSSSSSNPHESCSPAAAAAAAAAAGTTGAGTAAAAAAAASLEAEDLRILLRSLQDPTGREDVQQHLTQQLLLLTAHLLSCNKVVLGVTTTAIARHVIGEAAKGRGYSLAADIQLSDARLAAVGDQVGYTPGGSSMVNSNSSSSNGVGGLKPAGGVQLPVVLRPLREVSHREVSEVCRLRGWALPQVPGGSPASSRGGGGHGASSSINRLALNFIAAMTDNLPASVYTILRTASHLDAFPFNAPEAAAAGAAPAAAAAAGTCSASNGVGTTDQQALRVCRVCLAPLSTHSSTVPGVTAAAAAAAGSGGQHSKAGSEQRHAGDVLCYSCQRQVLGSFQVPASLPQRGGTQLQQLLSLLPPGLPWW
jgi:hypothetical protein